jgi:hypothetical protein
MKTERKQTAKLLYIEHAIYNNLAQRAVTDKLWFGGKPLFIKAFDLILVGWFRHETHAVCVTHLTVNAVVNFG